MDESKKVYTVSEAISALGISRVAINKKMKTLDIKGLKQGKFSYITQKHLEDLKANTTSPRDNHVITSCKPRDNQNEEKPQLWQEQIQFLREQLKTKDQQLADRAKEMDQMQQLLLISEKNVDRLSNRVEQLEDLREGHMLEGSTNDGIPIREWLIKFESKVRANNLLYEMRRDAK